MSKLVTPNSLTGPGVIVYGDSGPGRWAVRTEPDGPIFEATAAQIAATPIHHQWFSGTKNGLVASWPSKAHADDHHRAYGVVVGRIMPMVVDASHVGHRIVVLADVNGVPLPGGRGPA